MLQWHVDLKPHASGDFSLAVVQANHALEDQAQVCASPFATYVGVYDGHGGPEASRFINRNLFPYLNSSGPAPVSSLSTISVTCSPSCQDWIFLFRTCPCVCYLLCVTPSLDLSDSFGPASLDCQQGSRWSRGVYRRT